MNTYILQKFESKPEFGNTLVIVAETKQDAYEQATEFLSSKGLAQDILLKDIWQLDTNTAQTTFICATS